MSYSPNNLNNIYSDSLASSEDYSSNLFNYTDAPEESIDPVLALVDDEYTIGNPSINVSATNNISPFIFPAEQPPTLPPMSEILPPQDVSPDAMHVDHDININGWTGIIGPFLYANHQFVSPSITGDEDANASLNGTTVVQVPPAAVDVEQGVDLCPLVEYSASANQLYSPDYGVLPPPSSSTSIEQQCQTDTISTTASTSTSPATTSTLISVDSVSLSINHNSPEYSQTTTSQESEELEPNPSHSGQITIYPQHLLFGLWTRSRSGTYVCKYNGPALGSSRGGSHRCQTRASSSRSLIRHIRIHARKEVELNIPADQRIAYNWIPDDLKWIVVTCTLPEEECKYYRTNGRRWKVRTLDRPESVLRRHCASDHFVVVGKGKGKEKSLN